jgi:RNA polymerase sigma-70 factor (ECF subfamily)
MSTLLRSRPTNVEPAILVDDAGLVARAKRERQEFTPLYRRYIGPVYRYCYYRLGSREDAEDATSQIFTQALAGLAGCRDESFRSWLFAIAHNVVTDRHRARRVHESLSDAGEIVDPVSSPETTAISSADADAVLALLEKLVDDQRRVIELRFVGLTDFEIGSVLGRSPGAVRSIQFRAVARLRSLLGVSAEEADDER